MNYEDQVLALFGEANPVSDLDTLEDLMSPRLEVVEQRTGDMTDTKVREIDPNRPVFKKERRRGLVYGLAAALVALILGSVVWAVLLNDPGTDVAPGSEGIATSFIEASTASEATAAVALLAPDATINHPAVARVGEYQGWVDYRLAIGWRATVTDCTGAGTEVTCTYTFENDWTRALEVGPFGGSSFQFNIADGQIQELTSNFDTSEFLPQAAEKFFTWILINHLGDINELYDDPFGAATARTTPEAIVLWEQYTQEYVASLTG